MLLHNPEASGLHMPRGDWETVRTYDTAWRCEQGRREEAMERARRRSTRQSSGGEARSVRTGRSIGGGTGMLAALLQYRCEHEDRGRRR